MTEVEQIKDKLDVAEIVGGYIELKQSGRNLKAPCPFHNEKTASFMVSPEKGIWHCFGCQRGGDIFAFVMEMDGLDFRGALEVLAAKAGVQLSSQGYDPKVKKEQDRLTEALRWAVKYYQATLVKNKTAYEYAIKKRKLSKQTVEDFEVGYAPDSWTALTDFLQKKGFTAAELKKAGLAGQKAGRSNLFDIHRQRLMFTICDIQGTPIGFMGRVLDDSMPKYLNTPQTVLFDKSKAIFGLHLAKEAIRRSDEVVIVEGNMDVVVSHQTGIKQVVAVSGTALTLHQLKTLSRLTRNIKIAFDADDAGLKAAERAIDLSQSLGITLSMVDIPEGKDPDDLIQENPKSWEKYIADAKYAIDYLFDKLAEKYDLDSATGKRLYSDRLATIIGHLADAVEQDHYVQKLASKINASQDAIKEKLQKQVKQQPEQSAPEPAPAKPRHAKSLLEEAVLAINLAYPEVRLSLDDLTAANFENITHQEILEVMRKAGDKSGTEIASGLPKTGDYVKILTLRGEELYGSLAPADRSFEAYELVRRLQISSHKDIKAKLSKKLREAETKGDTQLAHMLLSEYQALINEDE
ncbi:MAG TPA: DNA primase [Candidatus Dormibacteraeota bacterium]|nr:DNA primase [Candidatus Dormibacteraeota bacterium]